MASSEHGDCSQPPDLRRAENLLLPGDPRRINKGGFAGSGGCKFYGTSDQLVDYVNTHPLFISESYGEGDLLAAWRRGSLLQIKARQEHRIRSASPRLPRLVPDVVPVPKPAVISSGLPKHFLEGAKGLSVSTKDGQGRTVSTSISAKGMFQRLHKEDKTVISSVFLPPARSSTERICPAWARG